MATTNEFSPESLSRILLQKASKLYNKHVIFEGLDLDLAKGHALAVTGPNGSGKSTLIKVLAAYITLTKGNIIWLDGEKPIHPDKVFKRTSMAAPYLDLFDEFTLRENAKIYGDLKGFRYDMTVDDIIDFIGLPNASDKKLKSFSSGMKQRCKLALAFCADSDLLLLDEPLSNLDAAGYNWYKKASESFCKERIVVVGSNLKGDETFFCSETINLDRII